MAIANKLRERWAKPVALPDVQGLRNYLQLALTDEEKVPISKMTFDSLCTPRSWESCQNELTEEQLSTLFRVSEDEQASLIEVLFMNVIAFEPPPDGTEDRFHSTYDNSITRIIESILSNANTIRNSNRNTSTALQWPDYGLLLNNHCIVRGEEEGTETGGNPEEELSSKLKWEQDPLQYILGLL